MATMPPIVTHWVSTAMEHPGNRNIFLGRGAKHDTTEIVAIPLGVMFQPGITANSTFPMRSLLINFKGGCSIRLLARVVP